MVSALDRKLVRDFRRLWAQALAIALVLAAGVMTLVLGVGADRALSETRTVYYQRYGFADIFATATRAPESALQRVADIDGVAVAEGRVQGSAILDIEGMSTPATGLVLSMPDVGQSRLNRLHMLEGRLPEASRGGEVVISGAFAEAHGFHPGDTLTATLNGSRRTLRIVGTALSPEFVYSLAPGDVMPDNRRFGILWMRYSDVAPLYDLKGAFNSLSVKLAKGARQPAVIDAVDRILKPYGGRGAIGRKDQISNAFLDAELTQLGAMSWVLPPIFLGIAAFLVNMTLSRLIALEREQIGLLKAIGYTPEAIAWHYVKFALLIAAAGIVLGWVAGSLMGRGLAAMYAEFYRFPFLYFEDRPDVFAISGMAALAAAVLGSIQAVRATLALSPAVAMAAPIPPRYRHIGLNRAVFVRLMPRPLTMALRNMARTPVRALLTAVGIVLSTGLLVGGLFAFDSIDYMIDATYNQAERQQATLTFAHPITEGGIEDVRRLPGVMAAEPFRAVAVEFRNANHVRRGTLSGKPAGADLSRVIDKNLDPVPMPDYGLALSEKLARILHVGVGDSVSVEILDGRGKVLDLPVTAIIQQFIGLGAYMRMDQLNRVLGEGPLANGADLMFDTARTDAFYRAIKQTPVIVGITLQRLSVALFRQQIGENIGISMGTYIALAVIIVFGVVYNSMRIQLSERARELASLRVLGFTRGEVSAILLGEILLIVMAAIPLGWLTGYGIAALVTVGFESDLYRIPLVINRQTYAVAGLIVLGAALASALIVRRRVDTLDLIAVLKTRE